MSDSTELAELLQQGIAAAKAERTEEARILLLQAAELDERNEQAWLWLSGVVESEEERRVCLENVLAINPLNAHAQAGLKWLRQHGATASATEEPCPRCEESLPQWGTACPHCGLPLIVACPACGQYAEVHQTACPDCGQYLGDFREGTAYHLALAQAYLERNRLDRTQEAIARAEAESPNDPQVLASLAALQERTGRLDSAIAGYERAIEREPDNALLYTRLGAAYRYASRTTEARAMLQKAVDLADRDPAILSGLAQLYLQEDDTVLEAVDLLQEATGLQPMNAQAHLLLGDAQLRLQHQEQAQQCYGQACQLTSPDSTLGVEARRKLAQVQASSRGEEQITQTGSSLDSLSSPRRRPGCVTLYAGLTGFSAIMGILSLILVGFLVNANRALIDEALMILDAGLMGDSSRLTGMIWIWVAIGLVISALNLAIAIGLWNLKNWARIAVIILQALGLLGTMFQAGTSVLALRQASGQLDISAFPTALMCSFLLAFVIQGYVIFWFLANGEFFD